MIEHYGLFNHHEEDNTLFILFSDNKVVNKTECNGVVSLFDKDNALVGYSIANFIRIAKIKYSGILFLPSRALVDAINSELINAHLEPISYKTYSGYVIENIEGKKVVYAREGTFLKDETISKGHVCTYDDLFIQNEEPNQIIYIDEDVPTGIDFFQMEE